ncbi:FAD-binding protein [Bartonella tribocorum]|uniref:Salicylate hydroxylase n=1 Tax=Bartonella tribocorum (strain DSM 28219 / CCUG 45778 / CIP 105476 / IBS 506) TaxID=382640 RepID=A9IVJ0_BART1|nr:FAD-binding protein [Bartonella tribocorum]CAK01725.1 salicylate hydroxylase [Bartonella tribocorum CIP 105476]CDO48971.1 salicylate hydroxylase [Bartonella tribocorum]
MKSFVEQSPIIVGGGIAGLSTALALAHKGIASTIIEKYQKLETIGAGIQLTPNATSILAHWNLLNKLTEVATIPHFLELKDGISLKIRLHAHLINLTEKHWKAPYITIHRAALQKVLYDAVIENPLIQYKAGETIVSSTQSVTSIDITTIKTDTVTKQLYSTPLLIGCDGVWSTLRQQSPFYEKANFSGFIAWRATTTCDNLPQNFYSSLHNMKTITAWMGPNNHLVIYPIQSSEKVVNFVAITHGKNPEEGWAHKGDKEKLKSLFKGWNSKILQIFDHIDEWKYWPLFHMKQNRFLGLDRQVFVGDCAHAALPFAAQGAAMAIEDAATLAEALSLKDLSLTKALSLYEKTRTPRIVEVKKRTNFNRLAYHATGPIAIARNLMMKIRTPESIMSSLNWLYRYDAINSIKNRDKNL